ncbi:hypothetical protein M8C21_026312 [Ambrosia artemisiifolia]|uniref:Uncharacterized protein n=1 Tax=Ambrosia artemisiifolia TaxID=4212 RepID=A0AAD5D1G0_AMBAR|nr:hypothetical protein M8C21_026312 [Ambrosia artemisiifolia]
MNNITSYLFLLFVKSCCFAFYHSVDSFRRMCDVRSKRDEAEIECTKVVFVLLSPGHPVYHVQEDAIHRYVFWVLKVLSMDQELDVPCLLNLRELSHLQGESLYT